MQTASKGTSPPLLTWDFGHKDRCRNAAQAAAANSWAVSAASRGGWELGGPSGRSAPCGTSPPSGLTCSKRPAKRTIPCGMPGAPRTRFRPGTCWRSRALTAPPCHSCTPERFDPRSAPRSDPARQACPRQDWPRHLSGWKLITNARGIVSPRSRCKPDCGRRLPEPRRQPASGMVRTPPATACSTMASAKRARTHIQRLKATRKGPGSSARSRCRSTSPSWPVRLSAR
jgi:hypothetical protein